MTLHVELVVPDREIWSGSARMVIAKTLEGDLGVLASHPPVLGILAEGSVVRILDPETTGDSAAATAGGGRAGLTKAAGTGSGRVDGSRCRLAHRRRAGLPGPRGGSRGHAPCAHR